MEKRVNRVKRMPIVFGLLLALPLLFARGVPMTDLALHEGMVALLVRLRDPHFTGAIYTLNLGHSNQLFYALAVPLSFALGSDYACRVVVALALALTFEGAARLCDHVGAHRAAALLVAPAAMGWTFFLGFAPNLLGTAILLWAVPSLDTFAQTPSPKRALGACGLIVLLHFAHETSALSACVCLAVLSIAHGMTGLSAMALRALPLALGGLLVWIELQLEKSVLTAFGKRWIELGVQTHPIDKKLEHVLDFLMGPQGAIAEFGVFAIVAAALVAFAIARRDSSEHDEPLRTRRRFEALAAVFFALYMAAPFAVNFGAFLYVRFLVPAYVVAVVALTRGPSSRMAIALCGLTPIAWLIVVLPQIAHADRERRAVDSLLSRIDEGSSVEVLGYASQGGARPYDPLSQGNRVLAERGGRALHSFVEYPIAPVVMRHDLAWDEATMRVYVSPVSLRPAFDLTRFRYLLLRIPDPARAALATRALAPDAELRGAEGAWRLFESKHDVVRLDSADAPLPSPPPPTIQERVNEVLRTERTR